MRKRYLNISQKKIVIAVVQKQKKDDDVNCRDLSLKRNELKISDERLRIQKRKKADFIRKMQCAIAEIMAMAGSEVELFDMIRGELFEIMEVDNFVIADYDENSKMLSARPNMRRDTMELIERWPAEKSLTKFLIDKKKALRFSKAEIHKLAEDGHIEFIGKIRAESWVGVPLQNKNKVVGAMLIQSYSNPCAYDDDCVEILQNVGNQISVYLEKMSVLEEFQKSESLFRTFFEQNSVGFAIIKPGGEWLRFNNKLCEILGYNPKELGLLTWRDIPVPENVEKELEELIIGKTDCYMFEKQYIRRDGFLIDVSINTRLLRNRDGSPQYFISTVQDVSSRKRAERDVQRHQEALIAGMAMLAEHRDHRTGEHIRRTKAFVCLLLELSRGGPYPLEHVDLLCQAAVLHDIGKVGVPDAILLKPDRLNENEFNIVKRHTVIGSEVLAAAARIIGDTPLISYARQIIESHHEKWDGSGYPHGLKGEEIPFIARIMAIADVYDALVSERPYKRAFSHEEAVSIIAEGAGKHFDPHLATLFLHAHTEFKKILQEQGED